MSTFRFSHRSIVRATALAGTGIILILFHPIAIDAWAVRSGDATSRIADLRRNLPVNLSDGSVLNGVELNGARLTLDLAVDERLGLGALRDRERDEKCHIWRSALRSRELVAVEYRYRQAGVTASLFLDRSVCG